MKNKETLEEFAKRRFSEERLNTYTAYNIEDAIKEGAKWQLNQFTIEEQSVGHTIDELDKEYIKGFNECLAYYIERMYSEEEVQVKLYECLGHFAHKHNIIINGNEIDKWFEQFKKK